MSSTTHGHTPHYFVPAPSRHPAMAALGLFFVFFGAAQWMNGANWGKYALLFGLVWWLGVLYQWFRDAIAESEGGQYGHKIEMSYRWSMTWFIFSEVMFFGAFFTALWWVRAHSVPALGSLDNAVLWPDFKAVWPSLAAGATASPGGIVESFTTMGPWPIPTINTAINTLEPGCDQRPHRHNGAAVTLAIQGEGIHSMIDGKRVNWSTGAAQITPATLLHSHHSTGTQRMRSFVIQDEGLHHYTRTPGFSFG